MPQVPNHKSTPDSEVDEHTPKNPCCCCPAPSNTDRQAPYKNVSRELSSVESLGQKSSIQVPPHATNAMDQQVAATSPKATHTVVERTELDRTLSTRMNWKISVRAALTTMIAIAKFKRLACKARQVVAARNNDGTRLAKYPLCEDYEKSPTPREDKIEEGKRLLQERLDFLKVRIVDMVDDGNCQFRAFALELFGTQDWHDEVRTTAVAWLRAHTSEYSLFIGEPPQWEDYLRDMAAQGTWGDELTLRAVCDAYGAVIHLITTEQEHWHILYEPAAPLPPFRHLFLAYISPIHYNTVVLAD